MAVVIWNPEQNSWNNSNYVRNIGFYPSNYISVVFLWVFVRQGQMFRLVLYEACFGDVANFGGKMENFRFKRNIGECLPNVGRKRAAKIRCSQKSNFCTKRKFASVKLNENCYCSWEIKLFSFFLGMWRILISIRTTFVQYLLPVRVCADGSVPWKSMREWLR